MDPEEKREEIFTAAIEIEDRLERDAYITRACGEDGQLLENVQRLLHYHDGNSFLDTPALESVTNPEISAPIEHPGTVIGRYKLLEKIGEGGMAVVYMAEQERPIRRKVALKIIKLGMDTKSVIARFEAERRALAMMDHPNIAKVLDAGATDTGRPYFVMELVKGVSITSYCDTNLLNTQERLELFTHACRAVQHAHQKGIIHRDIKPSNIMVTMHEGVPTPKIIDFGIAKAVNQRLTEKTLFTRYAQIIGTPAYMSPEQAEMSDSDIDTRADIYSLGVLLYELLTGTTPFSEEELRKAGYVEMQRVICEGEPAKPSTKLSTLGATLTDIAKHRSATPDLLKKAVRGDLDWIVMKALEKQRNRRYETARALSADVLHHLNHEPISARRHGIAYVLGKYIRRHKTKIMTTATAMILAAAIVALLLMWNGLARSVALADRAILSQARDALADNDPVTALEHVLKIRRSRHVGIEAQLLCANILVESSQPTEAIPILESLLTEKRRIAGDAHALLARVYWEGDYDEGEKLRKVAEHRQKAEELLPETAESHFLRALTTSSIKEKLDYLDEALDLEPGHRESLELRSHIHYASRQYEAAEADARVMVALLPQDNAGYKLRGMAFCELGRLSEAVAEYDRALALTLTGDPQYVELNARRCETLMRMGQYERVLAEARNCLKNAPNATALQSYIFCALTALGRHEQAQALMDSLSELHNGSDDEVRLASMKHVFDTLAAGGSWHPPDNEPDGTAFFYMLEAEEMYHELSTKARRLITDCSHACWSPDGTKAAYTHGLRGYSGVAVYDLESRKTNLLIAPGKDPSWSPDGRHIAFVRDAPAIRIADLTTGRTRGMTMDYKLGEEVWLMQADGSSPRRLARQAHCPSWSADAKHVYYRVHYSDHVLHAISIEEPQAKPVRIRTHTSDFPAVSPQGNYIANVDNVSPAVLRIVDVATQSRVAGWPTPLDSPTASWSPDERELSLGGLNGIRARTGLWIYDLAKREGVKVLSGHVTHASWSPDRTRLLIHMGKPFWEVWIADLDPNLSTAESFGSVRTLEEHCLESIEICTRELETEPDSFVNRWTRATSALWIKDPRASAYLQELDLYLGQPPFRRSLRNCGDARGILTHPVLCERLGELAWILARRAVEQQPSHAEDLALLFESNGQHERAGRLLQIAQANTLRGSHQYDKESDTHTIVGCGADIGGLMDEFHFAFKGLEGDGSITARIESIEGVHPSTKAGVMIRRSLNPGAAFAAIFATPGNGVSCHARQVVNRDATTDYHAATSEQKGLRVPVWVRMERKGNQFSAFYSSDGTNWNRTIWSPHQISMPHTVYIGLAITSHDNTKSAEARVSHVTTTGEVSTIGHFNECQDIRLWPLPSE